MNDAELVRAALTAMAFRDQERLESLRGKYKAHHPHAETEQLLHVAAVCVRIRFGRPTAATGRDGTQPDPAQGIDPTELSRFLAEARTAGPGFTLPRNWLDTEGAIRGLLGEPDILAHIDPTSTRRILAFLVQYLTDTTPEIKEDFDTVIDRAGEQIRQGILK